MITICRKTMPALRASVMRDFFNILEREDWYIEDNHNKSQGTYLLFGNLIEFISVDQPQKIRGRKREVAFINEANELNYEDYQQLVLRTTKIVILDYNPSDYFSWIYDRVLTRDDCSFFQTTYKDNPYLEEEVVAEIERLKETDENYWRIYGLGERGLNIAAIFPSYSTIKEVPEQARFVAIGLDWGFTNDPTAIVSVHTDGHNLYVQELLYETGLTNQDLASRLREITTGKPEMVADSAEPKSIEELFRHGFNIKPSRKGNDSVRLGIDILKRHKIVVVGHSPNLEKELRNYKWQTDRNGRQINTPIDEHNHAIDAMRYVCINKLAQSYTGKYFIS